VSVGVARGVALVTSFFAAACLSHPSATITPPTTAPEVVTRRFGDITVHVVNTGWVRVKEAHRTLTGPEALRLPTIVLARRWTEFMPVLVGVIEHPEGVFLVDTGLSEDSLDPEHFACDPGTAFVYHNLLDFRFVPEQRIDRRLAALGIDPARVRGIVLTHRHADHTDGLPFLSPAAEIFVGDGDWPAHNGALVCRWPPGRPPTLVDGHGPPLAAFPASHPLTRDGRVAIVPLNGHTPGHLGVAVRTTETDVVFVGDATFSFQQLASRTLAGIVEVPADARRTLDVLADQVTRFPSQLVLAHDPMALDRFAAGARTELADAR